MSLLSSPRAGVSATFFAQGRWVEAYPATAGRIAPAGHLVGSHSFYHARMPLFSDPGFDEDVRSYGEYITRSGDIFSPRISEPAGIAAERCSGARSNR